MFMKCINVQHSDQRNFVLTELPLYILGDELQLLVVTSSF